MSTNDLKSNVNDSLFDKILSVVEEAEKLRPFNLREVEMYQDIKNPNIKFPVNTESKVEMFEAGLNIKDFEVITEKINPSATIRELIFNTSDIDKALSFKSITTIENFISILKETITGKSRGEIKLEKNEKAKSTYATNYAALTTAIKSAEKSDNKGKENAKRLERVMLIINSGKTPKSTFSDMELYNSTLDVINKAKEIEVKPTKEKQ